jgi:hypothetical protein
MKSLFGGFGFDFSLFASLKLLSILGSYITSIHCPMTHMIPLPPVFAQRTNGGLQEMKRGGADG